MLSSRGTESILTDTPETDPTRRATTAAGPGGDPFESLFGDDAAAAPGSGTATSPERDPEATRRGDAPGIGTGAPMTRRELRALREAAEAGTGAAGGSPASTPASPAASDAAADARPLPAAASAAATAASSAAGDSSSASAAAAGIAAAHAEPSARAPLATAVRPSGDDRGRGRGTPPRAPAPSAAEKPKRRHPKWPYVLVLLVVLFGGAAVIATSLFGPVVTALMTPAEPTDYDGEGSGEVQVVVSTGDTGSSIGDTLAEQDVVKTSEAFYQAVVSSGEVVFQPGTYTLRKQMSAASALAMLQDPSSQVQVKVTIPEGQTASQALELVTEATGTPVADLEAAAADRGALGIPAEAPSIEGYLFPATYDFPPGTSAADMVRTMVQRTFQSLDDAGVPAADRHRVLTLAALIQKEARFEQDFYKVSRVFQNRIEIGMPLQSDATVAYGAESTGRVTTTDAERADDNPYNTYVHPGLPVGPISNPGDLAIEAAMAPADGPWLYFVTVNTVTGDTVFSESYDDHLKAVAQWQQFMRDNPGNG